MSRKNFRRGIECVFSNFNSILSFFESISNRDWEEYHFKAVDYSIFSHGKRIYLPKEFSPSYIKQLVQQAFMCERLVLHLYPGKGNYESIDNYEDFLDSNCELVILAYDCCYLEIYSKNQHWLEEILHTAHSIPGTIVAEKYADSDGRTSMYV